MLHAEQIGLLVLVGGVQQELPVNHAKVLAVLVDAALAQQQDLFAPADGLAGDGPFLEGHLALVGSRHYVGPPGLLLWKKRIREWYHSTTAGHFGSKRVCLNCDLSDSGISLIS